MRTYKGIFIFDASTKEDALESIIERIDNEIARQGGKLVKRDVLGRRQFARPMDKRDAGVYANLFFELDPEKVTPLKERLRLNEDVFRVQILVEAQPAAESGAKEEE